MEPYYSDDTVTIYHGDCREVLPCLPPPSAVITDPPYGETALEWDQWPEGWVDAITGSGAPQMWCFGSMRMFFEHVAEFSDWRFAQDIVWEKHAGSGFTADRFKRVHEFATHWYRGLWSDLTINPIRVPSGGPAKMVPYRAGTAQHMGKIGQGVYVDDGFRLQRSVIEVRSMHGYALHPTEKPAGILQPLVEYSTNPGDLIIDPFAGSGSLLRVAMDTGRRSIGIEGDERYCEIAAKRCAQGTMAFG